jgi:hypothetical protein
LEEATGLEVDDSIFSPYVYDRVDQEGTVDVSPSYIVEEGERDLPKGERGRLREFARRAAHLRGEGDAKIAQATSEIGRLLAEGFHPIVYCRYVFVYRVMHARW